MRVTELEWNTRVLLILNLMFIETVEGVDPGRMYTIAKNSEKTEVVRHLSEALKYNSSLTDVTLLCTIFIQVKWYELVRLIFLSRIQGFILLTRETLSI